MIFSNDINEWLENNRSLVDSGDIESIMKKFDSDCTANKLICSFEEEFKFYSVLGLLLNKTFTIAFEMGIEIILYLNLNDKSRTQVYSIADIKNYDKISSLPDEKIREFVARAFSQERNIPLDLTRKMVEKADIDRDLA